MWQCQVGAKCVQGTRLICVSSAVAGPVMGRGSGERAAAPRSFSAVSGAPGLLPGGGPQTVLAAPGSPSLGVCSPRPGHARVLLWSFTGLHRSFTGPPVGPGVGAPAPRWLVCVGPERGAAFSRRQAQGGTSWLSRDRSQSRRGTGASVTGSDSVSSASRTVDFPRVPRVRSGEEEGDDHGVGRPGSRRRRSVSRAPGARAACRVPGRGVLSGRRCDGGVDSGRSCGRVRGPPSVGSRCLPRFSVGPLGGSGPCSCCLCCQL